MERASMRTGSSASRSGRLGSHQSTYLAGSSSLVTAAHRLGPGRSSRGGALLLVVRCQATGKGKTVAITGATGLVGSRLVSKLASTGTQVRVLTRNAQRAKSVLPYPGIAYYEPAAWEEAVRGADGVVNLAGEPIATRWTESLKKEILDSRVGVTRKLAAAINGLPEEQRPGVFVSSSAVG